MFSSSFLTAVYLSPNHFATYHETVAFWLCHQSIDYKILQLHRPPEKPCQLSVVSTELTHCPSNCRIRDLGCRLPGAGNLCHMYPKCLAHQWHYNNRFAKLDKPIFVFKDSVPSDSILLIDTPRQFQLCVHAHLQLPSSTGFGTLYKEHSRFNIIIQSTPQYKVTLSI